MKCPRCKADIDIPYGVHHSDEGLNLYTVVAGIGGLCLECASHDAGAQNFGLGLRAAREELTALQEKVTGHHAPHVVYFPTSPTMKGGTIV